MIYKDICIAEDWSFGESRLIVTVSAVWTTKITRGEQWLTNAAPTIKNQHQTLVNPPRKTIPEVKSNRVIPMTGRFTGISTMTIPAMTI